ncbi:hypothetical protein DL546_009907 [Coniochaeta pulveracea]|uniref:Uncharacterized protein n=1 Tax=Coniochaeta pulveracea TaxID=177199 RepID=A0A420XWE7_9PEZI|nr:hypothetical protein DL546_009907 [Coniochaeta pulveracea]
MLPVVPAHDGPAAVGQMVDTRLQGLESCLTRIETVFLDLHKELRAANQAPKGRLSLQQFYQQSKSALREGISRLNCAIRFWVVKQTLGFTILLGSGLATYYRFREVQSKAGYYEEDVKKLQEVYRQHYQ